MALRFEIRLLAAGLLFFVASYALLWEIELAGKLVMKQPFSHHGPSIQVPTLNETIMGRQGARTPETRVFLDVPVTKTSLNAFTLKASKVRSPIDILHRSSLPLGERYYLTINIHVDPEGSTLKPVVLWFPDPDGLAKSFEFDGELLAFKHNAVVVSLNLRTYRSFFRNLLYSRTHPERSDQDLTREWVRQNVAAFGGNPEDVTVFGLSSRMDGGAMRRIVKARDGRRGRLLSILTSWWAPLLYFIVLALMSYFAFYGL
ncbi:MAG: hypothetical protein Q9220_007566 [cf. Caloplaca sp. 1 TL-2023]